MSFKLQVGDVCRLKEVIPSVYKKDEWKTGLYRVKMVRGPVITGMGREDPRAQVYFFEKIKKDGTTYKNFANGCLCQAWDKFIDEGRVEIVK